MAPSLRNVAAVESDRGEATTSAAGPTDHAGTGAATSRPDRWLQRLPDRAWVPALAAAILAVAFAGALLVRAHGDPSLLVHAGAPCTTEAAAPPTPACSGSTKGSPDPAAPTGARGSLDVQAADRAFDGQFFYRLGVAPWSRAGRVDGVQFDLPALRNARWGYGALAYVASAGDPDLVPWALLALNVAAAVAVGAVGGALARSSGRHAAWGLLLALWPGFAYSLSLDTSELVASALLLTGLLALRHRRWVPAGLALAAAALTRDTTAVVPAGIVLAGLVARFGLADHFHLTSAPVGERTADDAATPGSDGALGAVPTALAGVVALAAFGAWQLVQRARFGELPLTSSGSNNLSAPLRGLLHEVGRDLPPHGGDEAFRLLCLLGVVALVVVAAWSWRATAAPLAERVAWLPAVAVVLLLNAYLWSGATAFLRAATEAGLLSILVVLGSRRDRLLAVTGLGLAGFWLLVAASQVAKLG